MSTTSTGSAARHAQVADRAVEGQRGLLVAGQHLRVDAEPGPHPGGEDRRRCAASRVAEVAQKRIRSTGCAATSAAYSSMAANARSSASSASSPVVSTPWPSRTIRALADRHLRAARR